MSRILIGILLSFCSFSALAQQSFKDAQKKLDANHCGIGLEVFKPNFGDRVRTENNWIGFNFLVDGFETKLGFGELLLSEPDPTVGFGDKPNPPIFTDRESYGGHFSVGVNLPFSKLRFGNQSSYINVKRLHPTFSFAMGGYRGWEKQDRMTKDAFYYLGAGLGARLRLPVLTIEPFINTNVGFHGGSNFDAFKWFVINTGVVFRFDGMKQFLSPRLVSVPTTNYKVSNYTSSSYTTVHYENRGGQRQRVETIHTTSSADVSVSNGSLGIQDIGTFTGLALKYSFNNYKRSLYIPRTWLGGIGVHGRSGAGFAGINLDFGKIGHGSQLEDPDKKWFRKVSQHYEYGKGTMNTIMAYCDIGFDISPGLLAMLGMVRNDDGSATSFASIIAGYSFGYAYVYNQQFDDEETAVSRYNSIFNAWGAEEPTFKNDPRESKSGYLGGWFLGIEVGVVSFRVQGFSFRRAPLANNRYFTLAFRIPSKASRY